MAADASESDGQRAKSAVSLLILPDFPDAEGRIFFRLSQRLRQRPQLIPADPGAPDDIHQDQVGDRGMDQLLGAAVRVGNQNGGGVQGRAQEPRTDLDLDFRDPGRIGQLGDEQYPPAARRKRSASWPRVSAGSRMLRARPRGRSPGFQARRSALPRRSPPWLQSPGAEALSPCFSSVNAASSTPDITRASPASAILDVTERLRSR